MNATPSGSDEVDTFLAGLAPETRAALEGLRRTIAKAAPDAVEGISYGVPADKPLPAGLVTKLVKARMVETDEAARRA
jgi:hypothetical protein